MRLYEFTEPRTQFGQDVEQNILDAQMLNEWLDESSHRGVKFQVCDLYVNTAHELMMAVPNLGQRIEEFKRAKLENPAQPYGKSDTPFIKEGPLARAVPKLRHAHLTQDVSIFYTISGADPVVIKLYGVFSHKSSGTGNAANIKIQQKLGKKLANQDFL
jgi:hypothetical protein